MSKEDSKIVAAFKSIGANVSLVILDDTSCVVCLELRVKPGSKVEKIALEDGGVLSISINAKPVDGEANNYLKKLLGKKLGVSKKNIEIISGEKSKNKKVYVSFVQKVGKGSSYYVAKIDELLQN